MLPTRQKNEEKRDVRMKIFDAKKKYMVGAYEYKKNQLMQTKKKNF